MAAASTIMIRLDSKLEFLVILYPVSTRDFNVAAENASFACSFSVQLKGNWGSTTKIYRSISPPPLFTSTIQNKNCRADAMVPHLRENCEHENGYKIPGIVEQLPMNEWFYYSATRIERRHPAFNIFR